MPTGYTAIIGQKPITFEAFALRCARAMGACVMLRDEPLDAPLPEQFEASGYYAERERDALAEIHRLKAMSPDEAQHAADEEYVREELHVQRANEESAALRAKYEQMLACVKAWTPPTKDHEGLKTFMIEQLEESKRFDCHVMQLPTKRTPEQWRQEKLADAYSSLGYARQEHAKEIARVEARNQWLADLRKSLC